MSRDPVDPAREDEVAATPGEIVPVQEHAGDAASLARPGQRRPARSGRRRRSILIRRDRWKKRASGRRRTTRQARSARRLAGTDGLVVLGLGEDGVRSAAVAGRRARSSLSRSCLYRSPGLSLHPLRRRSRGLEAVEEHAAARPEPHLSSARRVRNAISARRKVDDVQRAPPAQRYRAEPCLWVAGECGGRSDSSSDHVAIIPFASTIVTWRPPATSGARTRTSRSSRCIPPRMRPRS